MAGLSDGRESNPVKRGAWLARKIIAEPPADPPPNVPALKADETKVSHSGSGWNSIGTSRHAASATRKSIRGVWRFEEYRRRRPAQTGPVDAKSTLPDNTEVSGADDLKRYLSEDRIDQVAFSVLKHLTTYAIGRTLTYNELDYLKRDALRLKPDGYRMKDMVRYVVNSKPFLEK